MEVPESHKGKNSRRMRYAAQAETEAEVTEEMRSSTERYSPRECKIKKQKSSHLPWLHTFTNYLKNLMWSIMTLSRSIFYVLMGELLKACVTYFFHCG